MCQGLRAVQQSMTAYAGRFDAAVLTAAQASEVVRLCAQIEASAASIKVLAAARAAETRSWQHDGYRSASDQLAGQAGMSPTAAKRALETGRRLAGQPEVAAAALAGDVSLEQATAISDGVAADPTKAAALIDQAKRGSLPELNDEVAKIKAAGGDAEQRRRDRHARRSLRRWTDRDGALQAHLYGHPEDGASLWRMLDPIRRRLNMIRHHAGAHDSLDALDYDAVMTMAAIATGKDGPLGLADLIELGLFPQLDTILADRPTPPPPPPPAPAAGADPDLFTTTDAGEPVDPDLFTTADAGDPGDPAAPADLFATADPAGAAEPADPAAPADLFTTPGPADPADPVVPGDAADPADPVVPGDAAGVAAAPADLADPAGASGSKRGRRPKKLAGSPIRVMIRVDLDALLRGVALDGELCEIAGYGPVPVSVVEELLATENPFIIGILTKGQTLAGVYHHGRHPNAYQRSALDFLYPTCAAEGCSSRNGLQYDHRHDYAKTHFTAFDLLDRLCGHHHRKKTHHGWALIEGKGKRAFVPPHDPRHPHHASHAHTTRPPPPAPP